MIETVTVITVCMLLLIYFRPGTTPPSTMPLIIERTGKYRIALAPQLNLAQPFIETIAKRIEAVQHVVVGESRYEVRDKRVTAKGMDCYELLIAQGSDILLFEARNPQVEANDGVVQDQALNGIVQAVAAELGININLCKETSAM